MAGTVNVFEAAKRRRSRTPHRLRELRGRLRPGTAHGRRRRRTLYGVYKLANEGTARIYWDDDGVAQRRPAAVRRLRPRPRPGHDRRPDAGDGGRRPRRAVQDRASAAATQLHYAPDVAARFVAGRARRLPDGAQAFNLGGPPTAIADFVAAIEAEIPGAEITFDEAPLPFPEELPAPWFDAQLTPLEQGVRETAEVLRSVI